MREKIYNINFTDKLAIEIANKYKDADLTEQIARKTNNITLYCKIVNDHNKKRISNRKIDYQKCFGKRGWVKY